MSALLPIHEKDADQAFDGLLSELLVERSSLSAVESFSQWHETSTHEANLPKLASRYSALMPTASPGAGEQYAFEVDLDACSGCKACVVACHNLNGLEESETWRKVGWLTTQAVELPVVQHVTTACHHCLEPGCLSGCPVKAYEKDPINGIVRHLDDQCFGCKYCTMMCPYEVPQYSSTLGIVRKCDMCRQRLANDEAPACVQACPNQAIRIRLVNSADIRSGRALSGEALLPTAPPNSLTIPTTQFVTKRSLPGDAISLEAVTDEPHEGHLPLVAMLVLTQAGVGLWGCIALATISKLLFIPALVATVISIVGVHCALLHLGRPQYAFRAFLGWRTSWLSREAILFGSYMGAACAATTTLLFVDNIGPTLAKIAILSTFVVGATAVFCSAMIYVATKRHLWNGLRTIGGFFATAASTGAALAETTKLGFPPGVLWLVAAIASLVTFAPQVMDVLAYRRRSTASGSQRHLPSPLLMGEGSGVRAFGKGTQKSSTEKTRWSDFSARSGGVILNHLAGPWAMLWLMWGVATLTSMAAWFLASNGLGFASVVTIANFIAQFLHRWIYFRAVVTHRMPGAAT